MLMSPSTSRTDATRSMEDMLDRLQARRDDGLMTRTEDGWCRPLSSGLGFRYDYDQSVAKGGWDFYRLGNGVCIAIIDMVAAQTLPRRYTSVDYLALSAVLEGHVPLQGPDGTEGELADGFCTIYGTQADEQLEGSYPPGEHLRWVTVWLERTTLFHVTGLTARDLPQPITDFILNGGSLPCRKVPLSRSASLAAHQLINPPFEGGFRHAFLTAKALELACHILFNLSQDVEREEKGQFSAQDHKRLRDAMKLIRSNLDKPLNVQELAEAVGLTRQRLQLGFQMIYGNSVGRIRDKVRMDLALDLVRDSKLSMIEIALETGYEHPASFTRAFKAAFGISPIQMRYVVHDELRVKNIRRQPKHGAN